MPIGTSKVGALGGLVPGGSVTFNTSDTWCVPPGVKIVSITGTGGTGNPGQDGVAGQDGQNGGGGGGGMGRGSPLPGVNPANATPQLPCNFQTYSLSGVGGSGAGPRGGAGANRPCSNNRFVFLPGGTAGQAGSAGAAGTPGQCGQVGNPSSGLNYTFTGGNAGTGGNGGTAGNGGTGGGAGNSGNWCPANCGGNPTGTANRPGNGGSVGGAAGGQYINPCNRWQPPTQPQVGGNHNTGGGGGAGLINSGVVGTAHTSGPYPGYPPLGTTRSSAPLPGGAGGTPGGGAGGGGAVTQDQPCIPPTGDIILANANPGQAGSVCRAAGGGGGGGVLSASGNVRFAGGGGGGRGNASNPGNPGNPGNSGNPGCTATHNCVPVIPGGSYPIVVGGPAGGSVVISWNPQ